VNAFERNARSTLLQRREELIRRLAAEALHIRAVTPADGALLQAALAKHTELAGELSGVDGALVRLTLGTFGSCESCGRALGTQRLRADPEARYCLTCSEAPPVGGPLARTEAALSYAAIMQLRREDSMQGQTKGGGLLAGHHARLAQMFSDLVAEAKKDDRKRLRPMWGEFERALHTHISTEEASLLPGYAKTAPAEAAALRGDHAFFEGALTRFGVDLDLHLLREEAVEEFGRRLQSHGEAEDMGLYPWAEGTLSERELGRLRQALGLP
jgi:DnaK suppressor protein